MYRIHFVENTDKPYYKSIEGISGENCKSQVNKNLVEKQKAVG